VRKSNLISKGSMLVHILAERIITDDGCDEEKYVFLSLRKRRIIDWMSA
jgi:hypothetical protein